MTPKQIFDLRLSLGETQSVFGKRLGVHWVTISRWESGRNKPTPIMAAKLEALKEHKRNEQ